ncbi:MAG: glycosyltransferase family A protein [Synechococcus sp.]
MLTRNHEPYLEQAITSVRQQSYPHWQLLIGEDGSSDGTAAIARAAAADDPDRIRLFSSPDGALGFHRNFQRLLEAAITPYVAFLEGDDWWCDTGKLASQIELLDACPDLAFCGGRTQVLDQRPRSSRTEIQQEIGPERGRSRLSIEELISDYSFHFSSIVMRRNCVRLPAWIYQQYCLDRPLYLLAAMQGDAGIVNRVVSVYRLQQGGVWAPLNPLEKSKRSIALFNSLCRHFPYKYKRRFRLTLSHVLWSYLALALEARQSRLALQILIAAVKAAPVSRLIVEPKLTAGALRRIASIACAGILLPSQS